MEGATRLHSVDNILVLETTIVCKVIVATLTINQSHLWVVHELGNFLPDSFPQRTPSEKLFSYLILRIDPCVCIWCFVVFKKTVGISHLCISYICR